MGEVGGVLGHLQKCILPIATMILATDEPLVLLSKSGRVWVMCTHCSALQLVPPIAMVLILTTRSSPQKSVIYWAVVARSGWGKPRCH